MGDCGYGNRNVFRNTLKFKHSADRLVDPRQIEFVLDARTWNFLMASWAKASDKEPKFDFNLSVLWNLVTDIVTWIL